MLLGKEEEERWKKERGGGIRDREDKEKKFYSKEGYNSSNSNYFQ